MRVRAHDGTQVGVAVPTAWLHACEEGGFLEAVQQLQRGGDPLGHGYTAGALGASG